MAYYQTVSMACRVRLFGVKVTLIFMVYELSPWCTCAWNMNTLFAVYDIYQPTPVWLYMLALWQIGDDQSLYITLSLLIYLTHGLQKCDYIWHDIKVERLLSLTLVIGPQNGIRTHNSQLRQSSI